MYVYVTLNFHDINLILMIIMILNTYHKKIELANDAITKYVFYIPFLSFCLLVDMYCYTIND